jgi:hypothetical protein
VQITSFDENGFQNYFSIRREFPDEDYAQAQYESIKNDDTFDFVEIDGRSFYYGEFTPEGIFRTYKPWALESVQDKEYYASMP